MEELLELLKDSKTRTIEEIAATLGTSVEDVKRQIEYLERIGMIKPFSLLPTDKGCGGCNGCKGCESSPAVCKGCIPPDVEYNMGKAWEVTGK